eukprot:GHVU01122157.1.p1 GENE.GHVU01122157.1~~GHVU01122157.1.p1  ORF type:complete len:218 (+),score=34.37 GHVU01122157.1:475-1128(+)
MLHSRVTFSAWAPLTSVVVAQVRDRLCVWYCPAKTDDPESRPAKGTVRGVVWRKGELVAEIATELSNGSVSTSAIKLNSKQVRMALRSNCADLMQDIAKYSSVSNSNSSSPSPPCSTTTTAATGSSSNDVDAAAATPRFAPRLVELAMKENNFAVAEYAFAIQGRAPKARYLHREAVVPPLRVRRRRKRRLATPMRRGRRKRSSPLTPSVCGLNSQY